MRACRTDFTTALWPAKNDSTTSINYMSNSDVTSSTAHYGRQVNNITEHEVQ